MPTNPAPSVKELYLPLLKNGNRGDHFDMKAALLDVEHLYALKKGSVEEDGLNILTGLWAKKIQYTIDKQNDSDNEGSDEEESE